MILTHCPHRKPTKQRRKCRKIAPSTPKKPRPRAKEVLSHCDRASIALPQRLFRTAAKALSQRDKGLIATPFGRKSPRRRLSRKGRTPQELGNEDINKILKNSRFSGKNTSRKRGRAGKSLKNINYQDKKRSKRGGNVDLLAQEFACRSSGPTYWTKQQALSVVRRQGPYPTLPRLGLQKAWRKLRRREHKERRETTLAFLIRRTRGQWRPKRNEY